MEREGLGRFFWPGRSPRSEDAVLSAQRKLAYWLGEVNGVGAQREARGHTAHEKKRMTGTGKQTGLPEASQCVF